MNKKYSITTVLRLELCLLFSSINFLFKEINKYNNQAIHFLLEKSRQFASVEVEIPSGFFCLMYNGLIEKYSF